MIRIRNAEWTDLKLITDFQILMADETEHIQLNYDTVNGGVISVFKDPSKGNYLVAEFSGKVVATLLLTPEWSDWRNGTILWIQSVYVLPDCRGKGVFREMYRYVKEMALTLSDIKGIRLYVVNTNVKAKIVYDAVGMKSGYFDFYEWMKEELQ